MITTNSPAGSTVVLKVGSKASGVVETKVWAAEKQAAGVALLTKICLDSTRNSAARDKDH
jgi:hypothetical protein